MVQRILVGLDGSPLAESILPYVTSLAKGLGAEVTLLQVAHLPEELRAAQFRTNLEQLLQRAKTQAEDYLRGVEERVRAAGVTVTSAVAMGDAATEIVAYAQGEGLGLIAMATHGRSGVQRWMYGSVADAVLHASHTPLLLIRPNAEPPGAIPALQQVLVPLDGSLLAEAALPYAETLAARLRVPMVLLRVLETVYVFGDPAGTATGYQNVLDALQETAEGYLNQAATGLRQRGVSVTTVAPFGFPASEIHDYAHAHPGTLVVMATHGRTGVAGLLLGSVARRVVQQAGHPILLVRPTPAPVVPARS